MDCRMCRLDQELASEEKKNSKERRRPDHVPLHKPCPDALAGFAGVVSRCPRLPSVVVYRYKGDGEREGGGGEELEHGVCSVECRRKWLDAKSDCAQVSKGGKDRGGYIREGLLRGEVR